MAQPRPTRRKLIGVGPSLNDLGGMPQKIKETFGNGLRQAQSGAYPEDSRPVGEGLPREVLKLVENHDGDTYRAAFVVSFPECVYLLHVFKKSAAGIGTPRPVIETIRARLAAAREHHRINYGSGEKR